MLPRPVAQRHTAWIAPRCPPPQRVPLLRRDPAQSTPPPAATTRRVVHQPGALLHPLAVVAGADGGLGARRGRVVVIVAAAGDGQVGDARIDGDGGVGGDAGASSELVSPLVVLFRVFGVQIQNRRNCGVLDGREGRNNVGLQRRKSKHG